MMKEHFALIDQGCESLACWGRRRPASSASEYCFGSSANFILDVGLTFLDGKIGFHSVRQTEALIHRLMSLVLMWFTCTTFMVTI